MSNVAESEKFFLVLHLQVHNYKALVMIGDGATDLEVAESHIFTQIFGP